MRHILPAIFLLIFTLFVKEGACFDSSSPIGQTAPPFELSDINGNKVAFADYKGKVILINFWATFCDPCKAEMPSLNNLYHAFKNDGFMVLAISIDSSEKPVRTFLKIKEMAYPVLMDKDQDVYFILYGVLGLPTSILIGRDGIIKEVIRGEREWDAPDMKKKIEKLLANKKEGK